MIPDPHLKCECLHQYYEKRINYLLEHLDILRGDFLEETRCREELEKRIKELEKIVKNSIKEVVIVTDEPETLIN